MADPRIKQMKIKTGVIKRVAKEKISYEKEAEEFQEKIKKMQDEGQEVYYIKKQDDLLKETLNVVIDIQNRLNNTYHDLKTFLENEVELAGLEEYKLAKGALEAAKKEVTN